MELIIGQEESYYLISSEGKTSSEILDSILSNAGMRKNSFAEDQIKLLFSNLLHGAVDLKKIYKGYYIDEYDSFREFLYQKETLEYSWIDSLQINEMQTLWEIRYWLNDYGIRDLIGYEQENLKMINEFLETIQV